MQVEEQTQNLVEQWTEDMPDQAKELVARWTKGLTPVTKVRQGASTLVTICKDTAGLYHVTAFFSLGSRWEVSADAQAVSADEAFAELARRLDY